MASTAISAQGTIVQIATSTGTVKTMTGVTVGYPTLFTCSSHGFANGDVIVASSGFTGTDAALVNGQTFVVMYKTTNTFAVNLDSTGKTITAGTGTFTPTAYSAIGNIKSITDFESGSASEIDVTNLSSTAKEKRLGLVDNGGFSCAIHHNNADVGQAAAQARRLDGAPVNMKVILPSGTTPTASFSALIKKFSKNAAVDGVVEGSLDVTVNGAITWS
jgi:hypothetical protein